jgi:integrase/recombinase XerD
MIDFRRAVEDYLAIRRSLGFSLDRAGRLLPHFVSYLERTGSHRITTALALAWATQPVGTHPHWWRERLGIVRGFARHLHAIDPVNEVPPTDLLPAHRPRVTPYLYSDADIAGLLCAARMLSPAFRSVTYKTLVGLLVVTGLRIGEAIGLDRADVDLEDGVIVVRRAKFGKLREVCLHESTVDALRAYARARTEHWPLVETPSFFISTRGVRLTENAVHFTFRDLVRQAQLEGRGARCRPRPHDLRHSFAVRTLLAWYRAGVDVEAQLPLLSTYLGHVKPSSTYWYLEAAPELLAIVGQRLEQVLGDLP